MDRSNLANLDDNQLISLAQQEDQEAFEQLVHRHSGTSFRLAVSILRNQDDAQDEVQNSFFNAWRHFGKFQKEATFSTWISRIVVNQCLMRLRKGKRAQFIHLDESLEDSPRVEVADIRPTPEARIEQQNTTEVLHREIHKLPPMLRNVLVLRDLQELPLAEVSARLGITVMAAKSRLLRARLELKNRIEKHLGNSGGMTATA